MAVFSATTVADDQCQPNRIEIGDANRAYLCELFRLLGDDTRLRIVCALMGTEMCVAHLAEHLGLTQSAVSHQLKNLKNASLVKFERRGKNVVYSLDDEHIYSILCQAVEHAEHIRKGE